MTIVNKINFLLQEDLTKFWHLYKKNREKKFKKQMSTMKTYKRSQMNIVQHGVTT